VLVIVDGEGGTKVGKGMKVLGGIGHNGSLIRTDIANILDIKERL